jgi:hypothetical protein
MSDTPSTVTLPTSVQVDGWSAESASYEPSTPEAMTAAISGTPAPETAETETPATDETSDDTAAASAETDDGQPRDEQGRFAGTKKRSATQRVAEEQAHIHAAVREKHETRRQLEAERAEIDRLRKEKETFAQAEQAAKDAPKKPTWAQFSEDGKTWDEYQDARDEWVRGEAKADAKRELETAQKTERERREADAARTRGEQEARAHAERIAKARESHPDFDEVLESLGELDEHGEPVTPQTPFLRDVVVKHEQGQEILYYFGKHPEHCAALASLPLTNSMMTAVRETESPTALLSWLATNPKDVRRIANLSPASALVALGRVTAQLDGAKTGSPPAASVTRAKPPIRPVGGSRGAAVATDPDDMPFGPDYVRKENERRAKARQL